MAIEELLDKTLVDILRDGQDGETTTILFLASDGTAYRMHHDQD